MFTTGDEQYRPSSREGQGTERHRKMLSGSVFDGERLYPGLSDLLQSAEVAALESDLAASHSVADPHAAGPGDDACLDRFQDPGRGARQLMAGQLVQGTLGRNSEGALRIAPADLGLLRKINVERISNLGSRP